MVRNLVNMYMISILISNFYKNICYRNYLLNSDLRKKITTRGNIIKTYTNIYTDGMCGRI